MLFSICLKPASIKNVKTYDELTEIVNKIKKEGLYTAEHPYFYEGSPFYLQPDDEMVREVPHEHRQSSWTEAENLHIYQL
jgi:hypothetical protein